VHSVYSQHDCLRGLGTSCVLVALAKARETRHEKELIVRNMEYSKNTYEPVGLHAAQWGSFRCCSIPVRLRCCIRDTQNAMRALHRAASSTGSGRV
jgi:hypothetical protein